MKKLVIIGAGCFQKALVEKANEMGLETHVFAWEEGAEAKEAADFFYPVSIAEKEKILEICRGIQPDGAVTIGSELANITVAYLVQKLGLYGSSEECVRLTTNKGDMRKALQAGNVACPRFWVLSEEQAADFVYTGSYPAVVKPTDRSGSRGVRRVENARELRAAIEDAYAQSFEKRVIVEEWIEGKEYSCEGLSWQGTHHFLAVTEKFTTGSPEFVETGHLEPGCPEDEEYIHRELGRALDVLGVRDGASHAEFKLDKAGKLHIIEIGSRMGGDCIGSDLVHLSTGIDYVKNVIRVALGETPSLEREAHYGAAAIKFVLGEKDRELLKKVRGNERIRLIYTSPDAQEDRPVTDSSQRSGYFIFAGDDRETLREILAE